MDLSIETIVPNQINLSACISMINTAYNSFRLKLETKTSAS